MPTKKKYELGVFPVDTTNYKPLEFSKYVCSKLTRHKVLHLCEGNFDGSSTLIFFYSDDVESAFKLLRGNKLFLREIKIN